MVYRVLVVTFLSVCLLIGQTPPADPEKLEARLESQPDDLLTRAQLIRLANTANSGISAARAREIRRKHILWLIENKPGATVLSEIAAVIDKSDAETWADADRLWRTQLAGSPSEEVYVNAINFYRSSDLAYARTLAFKGRVANLNSLRLANSAGSFLALALLGVKQVDRFGQATAFDDALLQSEDAARARTEIQTTQNPTILGAAAETLSQQQFPLVNRNRAAEAAKAVDLSEKLFLLAAEIDPNNRRWKSGLASLYWTSGMRKATQPEKIALLEKSLRAAGDASPRSYVLADLTLAYFANGDAGKAAEIATQAIAIPKTDSNYGGAMHSGNIVLGRIAVKKGDLEEAKRRLLAAGSTPGSPSLNSFGPNWDLAQELYGKGERETVLAYIELCRKFWKSERGRLDTWAAAIRDGNTPNFLGGPPIPTPQLVGRSAPAFRLRKLKGGDVSLAEFKGKVVLVDFWATWCGPCRQEMPHFETLHRELSGKDVVILAVDVNESEDLVSEYIDKEKYTFPVLLSQGSEIAAQYGVNAYPTLVAIDKAGLVADYVVGSRDEAALRGVIEKARGGAPAPSTPQAPSSTARPAGVPPPVTAEDFYREGVRLHGGKDTVAAVKALDNAIALNPRLAAAWELRGHCNADLRRMAEAIADYTRSIELFPYQAATYNNRGLAYLETGKPDEAAADFNKAIELNPAYVLALQNRVRLYLLRKQYAEAIADCDAALRSNPGATWAVQRRADARKLMSAPVSALPAPKLLSPADGASFSNVPRDTTLVWAEVPGAASYVVEWDYKGADAWASDQRGTAGVMIRSTEPSVTFKFIGAQPGRWRVWSVDPKGAESAKSDWREFSYTR